MPNEDLLTYIREARAAGIADADIRKNLEAAGWAAGDVARAFGKTDGLPTVHQKEVFPSELVVMQDPTAIAPVQKFVPMMKVDFRSGNSSAAGYAQNSVTSEKGSPMRSSIDERAPAKTASVSVEHHEGASIEKPTVQWWQVPIANQPQSMRESVAQNKENNTLKTFVPSFGGGGSFSRHNTIVAAIAVGILLVLGGGAFAGWHYYTTTVLPKSALVDMREKMGDVKRSAYKISIKVVPLSSEKKQANAENSRSAMSNVVTYSASVLQGILSIFHSGGANAASLVLGDNLAKAEPVMSYTMPMELQNVELEIRSSGIFDIRDDSSINFSTLIDLNLKQQKQQFGLGAEFRSIGDTYYFRLVELPMNLLGPAAGMTPLSVLDVTQFIKKWYSIKAATIAELKLIPDPAKADKEQKKKTQERIRELYKKSELYDTVSVRTDEKIGGDAVYSYVLKPRAEQIKEFFKELRKIGEDRQLTKMEEDQLDSFADALAKSDVKMRIGEKDHFIRKIETSIPDLDYSGTNFKTDMTLEFSDLNTATLQRPAEAIEFDDQFKKLVGGLFGGGDGENIFGMDATRMKSRDARRTADIIKLQVALELYFDDHGGYPKSLKELGPKDIPLMPTDPSTNKDYSYAVSASGKSYHIGASVEQKTFLPLTYDSDCNSKTLKCADPENISGRGSFSGGFDGSDEKGCAGEENRYCYDIIP